MKHKLSKAPHARHITQVHHVHAHRFAHLHTCRVACGSFAVSTISQGHIGPITQMVCSAGAPGLAATACMDGGVRVYDIQVCVPWGGRGMCVGMRVFRFVCNCKWPGPPLWPLWMVAIQVLDLAPHPFGPST